MSFPAYSAYMDAGVDWLGKIPEHWQQKWLGLLAVESRTAFVDGPFGSDLKSSDYQEEGIPLIQLNNIRDGLHVLRNMKFISEEKRNELSRHSAFPGDIVIAKMADPVARSAIVSDEFSEYVIVADCVKMTPDLTSVDLSFLIWAINSDCVRISAELMSSGVTRIRINLGQIKKLRIPYPPLREQTQIARFLDHETARIDALIEEQQRLIELLKEKRQSVISRAVTKGLDLTVPMKDSGVEWLGEVPAHWSVKALRYLGDCQNGINIGGEAFGSGSPFVSYGDVHKNHVLPAEVTGLVQSTSEDQQRYSIEYGDVFFTRTSETVDEIGFSATCFQELPNAVFAGFLIRFRPTAKSLAPGFSKYYFRNQGLRIFFNKEMNLITRASLSQDLLKLLPVSLPPVVEQIKISDFLDRATAEFASLLEHGIKAIDLLKERRSALISAAVTGKIDVRGWQPPASVATPELAQEAV